MSCPSASSGAGTISSKTATGSRPCGGPGTPPTNRTRATSPSAPGRQPRSCSATPSTPSAWSPGACRLTPPPSGSGPASIPARCNSAGHSQINFLIKAVVAGLSALTLRVKVKDAQGSYFHQDVTLPANDWQRVTVALADLQLESGSAPLAHPLQVVDLGIPVQPAQQWRLLYHRPQVRRAPDLRRGGPPAHPGVQDGAAGDWRCTNGGWMTSP